MLSKISGSLEGRWGCKKRADLTCVFGNKNENVASLIEAEKQALHSGIVTSCPISNGALYWSLGWRHTDLILRFFFFFEHQLADG